MGIARKDITMLKTIIAAALSLVTFASAAGAAELADGVWPGSPQHMVVATDYQCGGTAADPDAFQDWTWLAPTPELGLEGNKCFFLVLTHDGETYVFFEETWGFDGEQGPVWVPTAFTFGEYVEQ